MPGTYLLDTNAISDAMAGHPLVMAKLARPPGRLVTCAIVRGEIRYGLERLPPGKRRANLEAKAAAVFAALVIEDVTAVAAEIYGSIRHAMDLKGYAIDDNDLWIAATILALGATLVSNDQGFINVPGLLVEDWTKY